MPSGLLVCRGARSGAERRVPLVYVPLPDERIVLIGSNGGAPRNPAWVHNLRAHPDGVRFAARGGERAYRAREVDGEERREMWDRAVRQYVGYGTYQERTSRRIPVFVLEPAG
jgi:deazaflavin-dependent oxidoreductase (nitroreductase family)